MHSSKEIIRLIKKIRNEKKMSLDTLSKKVGMAKSSLSRYENEERKFPINDVGKFAKALNTPIEYLLGLDEGNSALSFEYNYYPTSISAGIPLEVDGITPDDVEKITLPDTIMGRWAGNKDIYITKVNGDSMNNIMPDGTLIAVKPVELYELKNDDIVVFSTNGEYGVKHFVKTPDKLIFKPDSTDPTYADTVIHLSDIDELKIKGKVVMWIVTAD
ncbi:MAG TPA: XRE family transcriptional regulator [Atopostipes sp.]|nr:XRE family transcriptional regulator [Atopostipes sp.]